MTQQVVADGAGAGAAAAEDARRKWRWGMPQWLLAPRGAHDAGGEYAALPAGDAA